MTTTLTRPAQKSDLATMIDWAAREGWNPGLDDLDPFWLADPKGYFVSERDGRVTAGISLVRHNPDFAFLGFYIVDPALRGQGLGWSLWQDVIAKAGDRVVGLDGVVAQQDNYRKSGFVYAHANIRFGGRVETDAMDPERIVPAETLPFSELLAFDATHNPGSRPAFLRAWLADTENRKSYALLEDGRMTGLGTIRTCRSGCKIGPLFAETAEDADSLFCHLVAEMGGGEVFLDIPETNAEARVLCGRHGLAPVFETARMYRGHTPVLPLDRIFGITTFELG